MKQVVLLLIAAASLVAAVPPLRGGRRDVVTEIDDAKEGIKDIILCAHSSSSRDRCTSTKTSGGENCVMCQSKSDPFLQNICTTPNGAGEIIKSFVKDLDCGPLPSHPTESTIDEEDEVDAEDSIQDITLCAHSGANVDQCTSTEMSDGENCVMCKSEAVRQSICTTPSASELIKSFIKDLDCGGPSSPSLAQSTNTEDEDVDDSFQDLLLCAQNSASSDQCTSTEMSDGEDCVFCTSDQIQKSLCTTPQASETMKSFIQDLDCGSSVRAAVLHAEEEIASSAEEDDTKDAFHDLLLCAQSGASSDSCTSTEMSDGEDCVWCTSDQVQQILCTTPQASEAMKSFIPDLDCGSSSPADVLQAEEEIVSNAEEGDEKDAFHDLLLCAQSGASSDSCTSTEMSDGEDCVWCTSDQVQQSLCTTPQASEAMKGFIPDLDCGSSSPADVFHAEEIASNAEEGDGKDAFHDLLLCAQSGASSDSCTSTEMSDGDDCVWCTSDQVQQSICTTPQASEAMKSFIQDLDCGSSSPVENEEVGADSPQDVDETSGLASSCMKASGLDGEACADAKDSIGEECIWCPSAAGNFGLCLTHQEAEIASKKLSWLKCPPLHDQDEIAAAIKN